MLDGRRHHRLGALGTFSGGGPVISGGSYNKEVDYYMMGQFSRSMPKGGRALAGTGSYLYADGTGVESVATLNPDGWRTVVIRIGTATTCGCASPPRANGSGAAGCTPRP